MSTKGWAIHPVDGAELISDIVAAISRYVLADASTIHAAALWIIHTWFIDVLSVTPIAHISAPEKRCGKTVLLTAMGELCCRPLPTANVSPAALFRCIEAWAPTLLVDEVDSFLRDNEEARGILNSGHTRKYAYVLRCVGDEHETKRFCTFGAKALCGIGKLSDTLMDRSIPLRLRRKKLDERRENIRHAALGLWDQLRSRIARWTDDHRDAIAVARLSPIDGLHDRANECWEPLFAIAAEAGGEWPMLARKAAMALHGVEGEAPTIGIELLEDVRGIFERKNSDKIFNRDLLQWLLQDEEAPWIALNNGKEMRIRQLTARLAEFGIKNGTVRIGGESKRGYKQTDFLEAFDRYLSSAPVDETGTSAQPNDGAASSVPEA